MEVGWEVSLCVCALCCYPSKKIRPLGSDSYWKVKFELKTLWVIKSANWKKNNKKIKKQRKEKEIFFARQDYRVRGSSRWDHKDADIFILFFIIVIKPNTNPQPFSTVSSQRQRLRNGSRLNKMSRGNFTLVNDSKWLLQILGFR